jgi:MYXO-CTERM domain-containing protein
MKKIYVGTIAAMLFFIAPVNSFAQESERSANTTNVGEDDDDDGGKWGLVGLLGLLGLAGLTRRKDNDRDVRLPRTDR